MRRLTSLTVGLVIAALAAAGCSDDGGTADTVATSTTAAPATTSPETVETVLTDVTSSVEDTADDDTSDGSAPGDGSEFCAINESLNEATSDAIDGDGTPATLQQFFEDEFPAQFAEITAAAPSDLVDDMAVLGEGFTALGALFAKNEWDLEASFNDPELNDVLDNQPYIDAGSAVDEYCGV